MKYPAAERENKMPFLNVSRAVGIVLIFALGFGVCFAQNSNDDKSQSRKNASKPNFAAKPKPEGLCHADSLPPSTVLVSVIATIIENATGRQISDLKIEDIKLFENDKEREIARLALLDTPLTIAMVVDTSSSASQSLREIGQTLQSFLRKLRINDKFSLVTFDKNVDELVKPTKVIDLKNKNFSLIPYPGGTKLYDAVDFVINKQLKDVTGRKVIIVFTDGIDSSSINATQAKNFYDAEESGATIYAVQYPYENGFSLSIHPYLRKLSQLTGGDVYDGRNRKTIETAYASIFKEIGSQYVMCYMSDEIKIRERRRVNLKFTNANYSVRLLVN